jgi:hypothetical protein
LTGEAETKRWPTGWLWIVLAVFLVFGSVGAAGVVYGLTGALAGQWVDLVAVPVGGVVAVLSFLFMAGILYRVDRYRGVTGRRIELFE